ncbi:MAG: 1-deoxy-D-xylulose-5-phosphate reductoisomerase [Halanaerobiales bacterium]
MKSLVLLGSTGSIGTQTLEVVEHLDNNWSVKALSAHSNYKLLAKQAKKFNVQYVVISQKEYKQALKSELEGKNVKILTGKSGLNEIAALNTDIVINAIVGAAGLEPSLTALESNNKLGLANKESLVIGGHLIKKVLSDNDIEILPIDSEHNAVFHLLEEQDKREVSNIILTASGGPFFDLAKEELEKVTVEDALAHPNWDMGSKISIDSATMMNKGLEVIEAHWLFDMPYEKIKVIVHPQSIIHSMIELVDNTIMADMGPADMRIPIQSVLTYPERKDTLGKKFDLIQNNNITFHSPDFEKFQALKLAYKAGEMGGSMPVVLNAANEVAVEAFLRKEISFTAIIEIVKKMLYNHQIIKSPSLQEVKEIDSMVRIKTEEELKNVINNS